MANHQEESEVVSEYRSSLNDLTLNSKPLINMLTMLAEENKKTAALDIVRCIEQRIHQVEPDKKLPLLYLMDSICKNISGVYVKLFTQNIVSTFCHVFEKGDEKMRTLLFKLRQTWSDIFPGNKLYALDVKIQRFLDPAWPVTAPKPEGSAKHKSVTASTTATGGPTSKAAPLAAAAPNATLQTSTAAAKLQQQVHINPRFLNDAKQQQVKQISLPNKSQLALPPETDIITAQLYQKQQELLALEKQKIELDLLTAQRKLEEKERALREREEKLKKKEELLDTDDGYKKKAKKRPRPHRSRSPSPVLRKSTRSPPGWNRVGKGSRSPMVAWSPQRMKPTSPTRLRSQRSPPIQRVSEAMVPKPPGPLLPPRPLMASGLSGDATVPTTIPAPSILAQPEMRSLVSLPCVTQNGTSPAQSVPLLNVPDMVTINAVTTVTSTNITPLVSHGIAPAPMDDGAWRQDRDYRREFEAMMFEADQRLRSGALSTHDHDVLVREMERAMHQNISHDIAPAFKQENLCVTPELTMLVDGRPRKLYYLDDSIAVVLMNGPLNSTFNDLIKMDPTELDPRQISFEGKPTKVFIDSDRGSHEFVLLEFNNQPQTFFHNEHVQRIKFGGPAKEIILNGKTHQAKFGGPPVEVWFAGDTMCSHTLRLDGPPPRVKLSEQPRTDLWLQIIHKATKPPEPPKEIQPSTEHTEPPVNINELLQKLVAAGIINKKEPSPEPSRVLDPLPALSNPSTTIPKVPSPLSNHSEDSQSVVNLPPEPQLKLSPESLKISRPSVIASLYNGIQCTNCSLRFDDKENLPANRKTNYAKHLDWHFRQNRKDKAKPSASAASLKRGWYYSLNLWLQFREVSDEDENQARKAIEEAKEELVSEDRVLTVAANSDESKNQCSVCGEKFDLIWVEEEEEWRLKNAVTHTDEKNYHPLCLEDLVKQQEHMKDPATEGPETVDAADAMSTEHQLDNYQERETFLNSSIEGVPDIASVATPDTSSSEDSNFILTSEVKTEPMVVQEEPHVEEQKTEEQLDGTVDSKPKETVDEKPDLIDEATGAQRPEETVPVRIDKLVLKENKLTLNLKSKISSEQKEVPPPVPVKEEEEAKDTKEKRIFVEPRAETSALCFIL